MLSVFVGCQPIYKPNLDVYAFELLFRGGVDNAASFESGDHATAALIMNVFTEIGLDKIVGGYPAFINVTRDFLLKGHALLLPSDRVVLEVLEDIEPDPEIIACLEDLSSQGYRIALDDFVYSPHMQPFIELADIVKVELPAIDRNDLPRHVELLRNNTARLLAEKIETHEEFELCRELGFDFFQGYFLSRPRVVAGQAQPTSRITGMQLVAELSDPEVDINNVVKTMEADPALCYKLLKYMNSAASGVTRHVESLKAAINHIGIRRLQSFTLFALFASEENAKPVQLLVTCLTRGRMCELIAGARGDARPDMNFLAGLFSMLDALLDQAMPDALAAVALAEPINDAILSGSGPLADVLKCVVEYENGNFDAVCLPELNAEGIRSAFIDALMWARQLTADLAG